MLSKFLALSWSDRWLLIAATFWLGLSRLALLIIPFKFIAPFLGQHMSESDHQVDLDTAKKAERIGWAVLAAARRTPWESACLAQAMAAKRLLQHWNIPSTLYLGMAKDDENELQAHAWVRCGSIILTGESHLHRYAVVSTFAD